MRFLLADEAGAGKTIMAGLFIKELQVRGDLQPADTAVEENSWGAVKKTPKSTAPNRSERKNP